MVVRQVVPCLAVGAVVLPHRPPLPLADVRPPPVPVADLAKPVLELAESRHPLTFGTHGNPYLRSCKAKLPCSTTRRSAGPHRSDCAKPGAGNLVHQHVPERSYKLGGDSRGGRSPRPASWASWTADERSFHSICVMETAPVPGAMVLNGAEDRGIQTRR